MMGRIAFAGLVLALCHAAAQAATVQGIEIPDRLIAGNHEFELMSCGVRDTLWMDAYAAGLYMPAGASPQATRDERRPKAVRLKVIHAKYLPADIPEKWRNALEHELARDPMMRVRQAYGRLSDGDAVTFLYLPDDGVTMSVNGRFVARSPGHALIDDILDAWAGEDSISGKLHRLRLDHPC